MAERFFVAVGGTGQNVALTLSRLVAIGAVKDSVQLRAIDPDNRGALSERLRQASLILPGRTRSTPKDGVAPTNHPLHDPEVRAPFDLRETGKDTLFQHLFVDSNNGFPRERELFEALFDPVLADTRVHEGMFARPAVGATVFASGVESGFLDKLLRPMAQAQAIYVCGSFVGGTGAGTMHKLVRTMRDGYAGPLYGLFYLPWFRLDSGAGAAAGINEQVLVRNAEHGLRYFYDATKDLLDVTMLIGQPDAHGSRLLAQRTAGRDETASYLHLAGAWGMLQLGEIKNKEPETRVVTLGHQKDAEDWLLESPWESDVPLRRRVHAHLALQKSLAFLTSKKEQENLSAPYSGGFFTSTSTKHLGEAFDASVTANRDKAQRQELIGAVIDQWVQQAQRLHFVVEYFQNLFGTELIRKRANNEILDRPSDWDTIRASWEAAGPLLPQGQARQTPQAVAEHFSAAILQQAMKG